MNITPYCGPMPTIGSLIRKSSIGVNYRILQGDEYFYELISNKKEVPLNEFIHPEDREDFEEAVANVSKEAQHLVLRMKAFDSQYRYFKLKISLNGHVVDGFESYDVTIMDIYTVENRAKELEMNAKKYRRYMALMDQYYFEYEPDKNLFKIFVYMNDKNNMVLKQNFDEFCADMRKNYLPDEKAMTSFAVFETYLRDCVDEFSIQFSSRLLSKAGRIDNLKFKGSTFYFNDQKIVVGTMVSKDRLQVERAYYLTEAAKDSATGLFNKRATMEYAVDRLKWNKDGHLCLIIFDIDNFKHINDTYGHLFGDEVISKISDVLKSAIQSRGVVGRFGGDEFMVILEHGIDNEHISTLLNAIRDQLRWVYRGIRDEITLTASVGAAKYPEDGSTYQELFAKADKALYVVKKNGKDGFAIYDDEVHGNISIQEEHEKRKHQFNKDWSQAISGCVLDLHGNGYSAISGVMNTLKELLDLDSIEVFTGDQLTMSAMEGTFFQGKRSAYDFIPVDYFERFNDNNTFFINNVERQFENGDPMLECCMKLNVKAFFQGVTYRDGKPYVLVSFDIFEHGYQWSREEMDALTIISKMIGQVVMEHEGKLQ